MFYILVLMGIGMEVGVATNNKLMPVVVIGIGLGILLIVVGYLYYVNTKMLAKMTQQRRQSNAVWTRHDEPDEPRVKGEGQDCNASSFKHSVYDCVNGKTKRNAKYANFHEKCLPGEWPGRGYSCDPITGKRDFNSDNYQ